MNWLEMILPYLVPPVMGAIIGYVTNDIAIRMLFRPLRPWHLLGVRIPLTPGIIPGKRAELAEKMGEMVGAHLMTAEDVGRALSKEAFRRELQEVVAEKLGAFLDRDLGPADSLVPGPHRERVREVVELLRWKAVKGIFEYVESAPFEAKVRDFLRRRGDELLARDLDSFLTPERYRQLRAHLEERIHRLLHSEALAEGTAAFIDAKTEQLLSSRRPIRELLPEEVTEFILAQLEKEVPPLLEKFGGMLYDPLFRDRLVARARAGIEGFLDSLQGMAGLLSGFINLEKIYARIPDFLDQASGEISRWLREERTQKQIADALRERIEKLLESSPHALTERLSYEKVSEIRAFVRCRTLEAVQSAKTEEIVLGGVEKGVAKIKDTSFGQLAEKALPTGGVDAARDALAQKLLALLRSPGAREAVAAILEEMTEKWIFQRPLGRLSARMPADLREELQEGIYRQMVEVLKREVPPLVESLNVHRMVAEKVNSLDILKVEGLLLGIMQEQFKYINLFGALLGFLIGLLNVLFLTVR